MHIRIKPQPPQLYKMPDWFADRVQVDTDRLVIPRGDWRLCTGELVERLRDKLEHTRDPDKASRIEAILKKAEEILTVESVAG